MFKELNDDNFLKKDYLSFKKETCTFISKICKKIDECLGINKITGNTELVLNQRGQWINPPIASEITKWEYVEIPHTLFTANATTQTVTFYTIQPKQAIIAIVLSTKEVFNNVSNFTVTNVTAGGVNSFAPAPNLNCLTILNTVSISNNGNLRIPNLVTTTNLQIVVTSSGGNVNAPTQGKINCWILTSILP